MKRYLICSCVFMLCMACGSDDAATVPPPDPSNNDAKSVPCLDGKAGIYPCNGIDLQSFVSLEVLSATSCNDSWGWVDSSTSKEYALVGLNNGTAFVDISDPTKPIYLGKLPTATISSSWRDIKVSNNHAFIVSEASNHGMQVFDLTKLRNVANPPATFTADAHYTGFGNCHNIVINTSENMAYAVGTARNDAYKGGVHFIDISNPKAPKSAGGYEGSGYSHDAQVVTYSGPDTDYTGKNIYIGSNENEVVIVDVTSKTAPKLISKINYSNVHYTHQGWFTEDMKYFLLGDELDEVNVGFKTRTLIFDFTDLDAPVLHHTYIGTTNAIDHNGYTKGNEFYIANYTAGIRVLDISNIANKQVNEVRFFDTYPANDNTEFKGVWNVYPYLPSGNIIVSDINSGLFILKKK